MKKITKSMIALCGLISITACNKQHDFKIVKDYLANKYVKNDREKIFVAVYSCYKPFPAVGIGK